MHDLSKQSPWTSSPNYHYLEVTTLFSWSQTQIALKHPSLSHVTRPSTQKELPNYTYIMWYHTLASPTRSYQTEMSASHQSSHWSFVSSLISNRTSVQRITLRPMELVKEPINRWSSTSEYSVVPNRTTGMYGSPSPNMLKTPGPLQQQRKHHSTYS